MCLVLVSMCACVCVCVCAHMCARVLVSPARHLPTGPPAPLDCKLYQGPDTCITAPRVQWVWQTHNKVGGEAVRS